jgi:hypothetical protein
MIAGRTTGGMSAVGVATRSVRFTWAQGFSFYIIVKEFVETLGALKWTVSMFSNPESFYDLH